MPSAVHTVVALISMTVSSAVIAGDAKPPAAGPEMVCKSEAVTGSRIRKKVCMSKAERDQREEQDRRNIAEMAMKSPLNNEVGTK